MSSNVLKADANYTFDDQELAVTFSSDMFDWRPVSFFVWYDFSGHSEGVEDIPVLSKSRTLDLRIDLKELDRHCLHDHFTFEINFVYDEDEDGSVRTEMFEANVSEDSFYNSIHLGPSLRVADSLLPA